MIQGETTPLVAVTGTLMLGGSSTFLVNLSRGLAKRGFRLPVVCLAQDNAYQSAFQESGAPVVELAREKLIYEDRLRAAYCGVAEFQPQAVLSCLGAESFEVLRLVPSGLLRMGIIQSHEPAPYETIKRYAAHLDVALGVSQEIASTLRAMPELSHAAVECIPYGVEFGEPVERDVRRETLRVIYLGRLIEEQKRVSRVVELVLRCREAKLPVEFTFVGAGPAENRMRAELASYNNVRFTGALPPEGIRRELAVHDVFVLLSDYEGLPLSLLEAMGAGVVPVVSDLRSGIREVVGNDCGCRVPVGDILAAFDALRSLAENRAQLETFSRRSAQLARAEYSADVMAGRYLALVERSKRSNVVWPNNLEVPVPYGMPSWAYQGVMRHVRRWLKPLAATRAKFSGRARSNRS